MHHVDRPDANLPVALVVFLVLADGVRFYVLADDTDLMLSLKAGPKYLVESELWSWEPAADGSIQVM